MAAVPHGYSFADREQGRGNGDTETASGRTQERQEGAGGSASEADDLEAAEEDPHRARPGGRQGGGAQARGLEGDRERRRGDDGDGAAARGRQAGHRRPLQDGQGPADPCRRPEATFALVLKE